MIRVWGSWPLNKESAAVYCPDAPQRSQAIATSAFQFRGSLYHFGAVGELIFNRQTNEFSTLGCVSGAMTKSLPLGISHRIS